MRSNYIISLNANVMFVETIKHRLSINNLPSSMVSDVDAQHDLKQLLLV